jgi:hypothetical protein
MTKVLLQFGVLSHHVVIFLSGLKKDTNFAQVTSSPSRGYFKQKHVFY